MRTEIVGPCEFTTGSRWTPHCQHCCWDLFFLLTSSRSHQKPGKAVRTLLLPSSYQEPWKQFVKLYISTCGVMHIQYMPTHVQQYIKNHLSAGVETLTWPGDRSPTGQSDHCTNVDVRLWAQSWQVPRYFTPLTHGQAWEVPIHKPIDG